MKVVLAGATGALGRVLIPQLCAAGHEVVGVSRAMSSAPAIASLGAQHVCGDVLDRTGLTRVLSDVEPEVVIHAAKAIPKRGPLTYRDMRATNRLHDEGTANLLAAAIAAGARRFVAESIVFFYGYGDFGPTPLTETAVPRPLPNARLAPVHEGILAMERHCSEAAGLIEMVVLRTGLFYGPGAGTELMASMLAKRAMPLPAGGPGRWALIYIEDLADAMQLALTSGPVGIYNVVDDEAVPLRTFVTELARVAATPGPWSLPKSAARLFASYFSEVATTSMTVSNTKAKSELGWTPAHPTYRDGLAAWAASR